MKVWVLNGRDGLHDIFVIGSLKIKTCLNGLLVTIYEQHDNQWGSEWVPDRIWYMKDGKSRRAFYGLDYQLTHTWNTTQYYQQTDFSFRSWFHTQNWFDIVL